jgi:hypothetical protein
MPRPNVIVGKVTAVLPATETATSTFSTPRLPTVQFQGGETAHLDPSDNNAGLFFDVLEDLRQSGLPAYVETHSLTGAITDLRVPLIVTVTKIEPAASGDLNVELEISHAKHVLRRVNPDFEELAATLQQALAQRIVVAVTETDEQEIIDVRFYSGPFLLPNLTEATPHKELFEELAPLAVTPQRAAALFNLVNSRSCNPVTVPPPCIPFLFPDDGCWGRAHEMCRLMIADGALPGKIWIYGNLRVRTRNKPNCEQTWTWHVAPVLQVSVGGGTQVHVVDPSMFAMPVQDVTWKGAQHDPSATSAFTDATAFYRTPTGQIRIDPTYSETAQVLTRFRAQLKLRSASAGPPPYAHCVDIV